MILLGNGIENGLPTMKWFFFWLLKPKSIWLRLEYIPLKGTNDRHTCCDETVKSRLPQQYKVQVSILPGARRNKPTIFCVCCGPLMVARTLHLGLTSFKHFCLVFFLPV